MLLENWELRKVKTEKLKQIPFIPFYIYIYEIPNENRKIGVAQHVLQNDHFIDNNSCDVTNNRHKGAYKSLDLTKHQQFSDDDDKGLIRCHYAC